MTMAALSTLATASPAFSDPWKDESGHGQGRGGGEWKQEYRDGNCKVERKMEGSGEYKEEVKCDGPPWARGHASPPVVAKRARSGPAIALPPLPPGPSHGQVHRDGRGRYCREYQATGTIEGRRQHLYGGACLQQDGTWGFDD